MAAGLVWIFEGVLPHLNAVAPTPSALQVSTDFSGGSALVQEVDQINRTIRLSPNSPPEKGWACWWYFKVEGAIPGETLTIEVNGRGFAFPDQAQFSYDNRTWNQTEPGERKGARQITYRHVAKTSTLWFAWGPPFVLSDATELVETISRTSPYARSFELARTREDRPVPGLRIEDTHGSETKRRELWIQARQHAWESGSSWVCRGLAEWIVSEDPVAASLRNRAVIYLIPVMDVDNVEHGFGGKNSQPHDHYWDWGPGAVYPEIRAAMKRIAKMNESGRLAGFIDLHNPGPTDRRAYFYVPAQPLLTPQRLQAQDAFLRIFAEENPGPHGFDGKLGRIGETYDPAKDTASDCWIAANCRPEVLSLTLEVPWNTPISTQEGYLNVGRQFGRSLERFLRETDQKEPHEGVQTPNHAHRVPPAIP